MRLLVCLIFCALAFGCKTTSESKGTVDSSGLIYQKDKALEKVWVAEDIILPQIGSLYVAPTQFTAVERDNEVEMRTWATRYVQTAIADSLQAAGIFTNVITRETDLRPSDRFLRMENTILEYEKGGGGARYFAGVYGAGQPTLKLRGRFLDGEKLVLQFETRRHGDSGMDRLFGGFISDKDVQRHDIDKLAADLADFLTRVARRNPPTR